MIASSNIRTLIKGFEGFRNTAYKDGNVYSIGYGNTYYANGVAVKAGDRISESEGTKLFNTVLDQFCKEVSKLITSKVNQNQFDALVSLVYNIGISAFRNSTLLRKVNANPNDSTIRAEFLKWVNSGGKELPGLVKRRKEEADYYFFKTSGLSPFFLIAVGMIGAGIILSNQGDE